MHRAPASGVGILLRPPLDARPNRRLIGGDLEAASKSTVGLEVLGDTDSSLSQYDHRDGSDGKSARTRRGAVRIDGGVVLFLEQMGAVSDGGAGA